MYLSLWKDKIASALSIEEAWMVASYLGCETSQDSYVHAHSTMHALQVVN